MAEEEEEDWGPLPSSKPRAVAATGSSVPEPSPELSPGTTRSNSTQLVAEVQLSNAAEDLARISDVGKCREMLRKQQREIAKLTAAFKASELRRTAAELRLKVITQTPTRSTGVQTTSDDDERPPDTSEAL